MYTRLNRFLTRFIFALAAVTLLSSLLSCSSSTGNEGGTKSVDVSVGAAFTTLDRADVYDQNGVYLTTFDRASGFTANLPAGHYHMDFVDELGNHSFTDDGRLAFAPTMKGGLPTGGPVSLNGVASKVWEVDVDPALEANAHLMERVRAGDPTLLPWATVLGMDTSVVHADGTVHPLGNENVGTVQSGLHTFGGNEAAMRQRVIWEASFAMKGDFAAGCNSSESCWQGTLASGTSYYANATNGKTNPAGQTYYSYTDYDPTAWSSARTAYGATTGNVSCRDVSSPTNCAPTIGSSNPTTFACQNSSCTTSTHPRGGECKVFQNLILFRAGIMHLASGSTGWLSLPNDGSISGGSYAYETSGTIKVGDALRDTSLIHSTIVAYAPTGGPYRVVDSNWVGTTPAPNLVYGEYIGSHVMSFSGTGNGNLGNYKNMTCVYNPSDTRCP